MAKKSRPVVANATFGMKVMVGRKMLGFRVLLLLPNGEVEITRRIILDKVRKEPALLPAQRLPTCTSSGSFAASFAGLIRSRSRPLIYFLLRDAPVELLVR